MAVALENKRVVFAITVFVVFLVGVALGFVLRGDSSPAYTSVRETSTDYKFITPLLFVKTPEEDSFPEFRPLKDAIANFADRAIRENNTQDISIYFRNLNTSQWVGTNTEKRFSPSSMLKVATLISVLREAESNPKLLSARVALPSADELPPIEQTYYAPQNPILPGKSYTVRELIEHLVVDSDNIADYALYVLVGKDNIVKIYNDLELPEPGVSDEGYTSQEYSRIFRTLYNATYLSRDLSEQVLALLGKTNFTQGIVQGIPPGTAISHKFGARTVSEDNGATYKELHDCGIVYFPEHPYFLCVMTRGDNFAELEVVLQETSLLVWQEVSKLHK